MAAAVGTLCLAGCAFIQPPPVPSPSLPEQNGLASAECGTLISMAHAALADVGAAAGDPAATAAAHAAHAAAMHQYHMCLARGGRP